MDDLVPPLLIGTDHLIDVEVLNASEQQRKAVDTLLHNLHDTMVAGATERGAFHLRPLENGWITNCKLSGTKMPQTNE
jgi:hypothetical protein